MTLREGIIAHNQGRGLDPSLIISHALSLCIMSSSILLSIFEIHAYYTMLSAGLFVMGIYMLSAYMRSGGIPSFLPILIISSLGSLKWGLFKLLNKFSFIPFSLVTLTRPVSEAKYFVFIDSKIVTVTNSIDIP